jgi:L-fucose isomerase-like protein
MSIVTKKIVFGVIIGTRGFFNARLAAEGRKTTLRRLAELGIEAVILPEGATATQAVETYADAQKCAELFRQNRDTIDGVLVVLPNFGDEVGIASTLNLAKLNVPVLVAAADDDIDKVSVDQRRDAFCGKISVTNNLYQYGIKFTDTTYHTYSLESAEFGKDLKDFAAVCRTVKGLSNARIGAIGARPAAFQTMRASEKLLQLSGITVIPVDLSEILSAAVKPANEFRLKQKLEEIGAYGRIPTTILKDNITKQAKLGMAVEDWMERNQLDATSVQCWDSLENNYGCAACLTMSMMGEKLIPAACEVDIAGVVSMYALTLAAGNPAAILDWNNNYGEDRNLCVCTHCSNYPKSFMGNEVEISNLDILGKTLGPERCFGAIKGKVAPGELTYFRLSTDDRNGRIRTYVGEGEFVDKPFAMDGGIAVTKVEGLQKLMKYVVKNGFEHHVAMVRGNVAGIVAEACENYLGWGTYHHNAEE